MVNKYIHTIYYQSIKLKTDVHILRKNKSNTIITYPASFSSENYKPFQHPIIFIIFLYKLNIEYNNK